MPYYTRKGTGKNKGKTCVHKKETDKKVGCTSGPIKNYLAALHIHAKEAKLDLTGKQLQDIIREEAAKYLSERNEI
tara:strand:- start:8 stop:235 length:228 start_codon:yes stop_codon:yes gene_type:complete